MTNRLPSRPDSENEVLRTHPDLPTPELNEIKVQRYVAYLEHSLVTGTQWAVFEPNGETLWARVRTTVTNFLTTEWRSGMLQGTAAEQAFFCPLRSIHHDPERPRQRTTERGCRRSPCQAGRIRDHQHRPMDRRSPTLNSARVSQR
jgi:hypothetical protein